MNIANAGRILPILNHMNERKLFVGNLKYTITEEQLAALFSQHGEVLDIRIMEGKGYAFVEMASPQQAQRIKNTLRETEFEGRRLLIDDVPSKQHQGGKGRVSQPEARRPERTQERGGSAGNRGYRSGTPDKFKRSDESVHHLTDVTDEYKKKSKPPHKSSEPVKQQKTQPSLEKYQKRPERSASPERRTEKPPARQPEREQSGKPAKPAESAPKGSSRTASPGREQDGRPTRHVSKKIKEKPPKNPNPYQGSKKTGKPAKREQESKSSTSEPEENEKHTYLRYWATLSGKKKE